MCNRSSLRTNNTRIPPVFNRHSKSGLSNRSSKKVIAGWSPARARSKADVTKAGCPDAGKDIQLIQKGCLSVVFFCQYIAAEIIA